ncbi:M20/M25/M40 family metallo-hydrolase [Streptomyces sp. NBC_01240]|uniref:M20/M25/M40 family metallo-hydrolase n=1 Tax=Streptomyces sp. NBC_01240 TaxID=2903793 RepID=UPI002E0E9BEF|nr:M20/M25/M40 family metallo-hydrolase [Streptomyces sp. NBC_01240]
MIADVERLVRCESPSDDLAAVARSAELVARIGAGHLGAEAERIVIDGCTHVRWRFGRTPRVLLIGHHDTVWPVGSLKSHPFEVRDGVLRGPGCFDMKAGLVMAFHALADLIGTGARTSVSGPGAAHPLDGVTLLITGDEEPGSPSSRELIEGEAGSCAAALVLEAAGPGGALKTERKGVSRYEVLVRGRAAHSGLEPERGVNATIEAAHQILAVAALGDAAHGTTVTPTRLEAGTTSNTVPASASFDVDVRIRDAAEQHRVDRAMRDLRARLAGAAVEVTGGPNRPPLQATASKDLFARACRLATDLGLGPASLQRNCTHPTCGFFWTCWAGHRRCRVHTGDGPLPWPRRTEGAICRLTLTASMCAGWEMADRSAIGTCPVTVPRSSNTGAGQPCRVSAGSRTAAPGCRPCCSGPHTMRDSCPGRSAW